MNIPYIRKLLDARLPRYRAVADLTIASGSRPVAEIGSEIYRQIEALDKADEAPPQ